MYCNIAESNVAEKLGIRVLDFEYIIFILFFFFEYIMHIYICLKHLLQYQIWFIFNNYN